MLNYLVQLLMERYNNIPNLIRRSFLHALSHLVRNAWFVMDQPSNQILTPIIDNFFIHHINSATPSDPTLPNLGLSLLDEIIQAISTYSYYTSYLDFRKTMISFQK